MQVRFDAAVLVFGTRFGGEVYDLESKELPQLVEDGNANDEVSTDKLRVFVSEGSLGRYLGSVEVDPEVLTPNGDGINDEVRISYTLLQLTGEAPVDISIYDVLGRRVRGVYRGKERNGRYAQSGGVYAYKVWDGRDGDGHLVPPGIYVYKITVEADAGSSERAGALTVVY